MKKVKVNLKHSIVLNDDLENEINVLKMMNEEKNSEIEKYVSRINEQDLNLR